MNKRKILVVVVVLAVVLLSAMLFAAVPGNINFQGRLLDKDKNPKSGLFSLTFSIWDTGPGAGGSEIWSEIQNNVQVTNGMFTVQLGAGTALTPTVFDSDTRWLQIKVGTEILAPRERLATSPYSYRAAVADNVVAGVITNTHVNGTAGIEWSKINRSGSSLADLTARNPGDIDAGNLPGNVVVSSIAVNAIGNNHIVSVSPAKISAGSLANTVIVSSITANIRFHAASSTMTAITATHYGVGTPLTALNPANISAGSLGADVVVSSVAVNAVGSNQISSILPTKISAGSLNSNVMVSSITANIRFHAESSTMTAITATYYGNGSHLTSILPASISAGSLGASVIVSSVTANVITNKNIYSSANIAWTKIDKTGSSLADLATKTFPQLSDVADFAAAQGDILIRTGVDWDRLPAGTDRYVLQTRGVGANPVWVPVMGTMQIWKCDAAAAVALQGLNLPLAQTELDATFQGTRIFVTGEDIGSQVQMHLNAYVVALGAGLTITVIVAQAGTPGNVLGTLNFSGAAVAGFQLKTAWAAKPAWLTGDKYLAVYTSGGNGTADFLFRDISIRWK